MGRHEGVIPDVRDHDPAPARNVVLDLKGGSAPLDEAMGGFGTTTLAPGPKDQFGMHSRDAAAIPRC